MTLFGLTQARRPARRLYDLHRDGELIRSRRYGRIDVAAGKLEGIVLRSWPKLAVLWPELWGDDRCDRMRLYYNEPRSAPGFLTLKYLVASPGSTYASLCCALDALDEIARLKRSDALVCEAFNQRISDRALARFGWERHCPRSKRRHFIKRFYGVYPAPRASAPS